MPCSASQLLLMGSLGFLAGIFFSPFLPSFAFPLALLFAGVFVLTFFWNKKAFALLGIALVFSGLGAVRFLFSISAIPEPLREPQEVRFVGFVVKEPEPDERVTKLIVQPENVSGRVLIFAPRFAQFHQDDRVFVAGELAPPAVFEDFDYRSFLAKDRIFWTMRQPDIVVQQKGHSLVEMLRQRARSSIEKHVSAPASFILAAVLLGDKSRIPDAFKEQLNKTGTRHITAISGMHVAIFASILGSFLVTIGLFKRQAVFLTALFVVLFVVFTGFQTSAIRAGIMGGTAFAGAMFGRQKHSLRLLVLAAAFMLAGNPLLLRYDVGFQLSFLAVLGILVFAPFLRDVLGRFAFRWGAWDIVAMTVSAQLFTLPVLLGTFGSFSLVALLTNVLILSVLPFVLGLGLLFLLLVQLLPFLGGLFSFPVSALLSFVVFVITVFSEVPGAAVSNVEGQFWWLFLLLAPLGYFAFKRQREKKFPFAEPRFLS